MLNITNPFKLSNKLVIRLLKIFISIYSVCMLNYNLFLQLVKKPNEEKIILIFVELIIETILCYTIFNIERLCIAIKFKKFKQAFWYALYFSIYTILTINPINSAHTKVDLFKRIIGPGIINGVDVSKRISNFSRWFLGFIIIFIFYYNY